MCLGWSFDEKVRQENTLPLFFLKGVSHLCVPNMCDDMRESLSSFFYHVHHIGLIKKNFLDLSTSYINMHETYPTTELLESSSQHWMQSLLYGELEFSELCKKWHRCVMNLTLKDQPLKPSIKDKVDLLCFNTTHYFNILHLCVFHYLGFWRGTQSLFKITVHLCIGFFISIKSSIIFKSIRPQYYAI